MGLFMLPLAFVALLGFFFLMALRIILGRGENRNPGLEREEAMLVQEIHASLQKMEKRVEALETLLIEKYEQDKNQG